jgi:Tol biopolymer transport system component
MTPRIRFTLAFAAAAILGASLAPAAGAWPGRNGAIVFQAFTPEGEGERAGEEGRVSGKGIRIASLGADRSELTPLTEDPGDRNPQASPDGRLVTFVRSSVPEETTGEPPATIYVIGTDGSGLRPLTDGLHSDGEPSFSASGTRVYFTRRVPGHSTDIFSVALGGGAPRRITSGGAEDRHPRASARGGLLTFERRVVSGSTVAHHHIYISRADGSKPRDLTPKLPRRLSASDPEFSPDGRRIAYSAGDRLISVRTDGTHPRLLIRPNAYSDNIYADPTYAPDGHSLLLTVVSGRSSLHRLDLRRLRPLPAPLSEPHIGARSPAWLAQPR